MAIETDFTDARLTVRYMRGDDINDDEIEGLRRRTSSNVWWKLVEARAKILDTKSDAIKQYRAGLSLRGKDNRSDKPRKIR